MDGHGSTHVHIHVLLETYFQGSPRTEQSEAPSKSKPFIYTRSRHSTLVQPPGRRTTLTFSEQSRAEQSKKRSGRHGVQEVRPGVLRILRGRGGGGGGAGPAAGGRCAEAADGDEPAVAVAGGPVPDAGDDEPARLHPGRAQVRDQELLHHQLPRRGRVRPRLQGLRRRLPPPGPRRAAGRRQVPRPRERRRAGTPRVAGGGGVPWDAPPPAPGEAAGVLQPGRPPDARLRVPAQGQPREPPLQECARVAAMVDAAQDRRRRRQGAGLPARGGDAGDLPRLQGLQHPARLGLHGEAVRLRAGEGGAQGGRHARDDAGDGHARLRGAGVHPDGPPHGEERRVQLRRRAPGAAHGAALRRQEAPRLGAEPRGLGAPLPPPRRRQAAPHHGPRHGVAVLHARRAGRRRRRLLLPAEHAQGAPADARRRGVARAPARARRRRAHGPLRVHRRRRPRGARGGGERSRGRRAGGHAGQVARQVGRARREPAAEGGLLGHQRGEAAGEPARRDLMSRGGTEKLRYIELRCT